LTVPLPQPSIVATTFTEAAQEFGEEREVTILFVDIRGSTSLAEARLPYDVIY
jgi:class 3 adenylate cyclase